MLERARTVDLAAAEHDRSDDVETLIAKANKYHGEAEQAAKESLRYAAEAGKALLRIKDQVRRELGPRRWGRWFEEQQRQGRFKFSYRTARLYMWLAKLPEPKWQRVATLSLREAGRIASLENGGEGGETGETNRATPPPTPQINPAHATVVDAVMQVAGGPDVILAYIHRLQDQNTVSLFQFDRAVRAVRRQLQGT
jgi:hypothetical protein